MQWSCVSPPPHLFALIPEELAGVLDDLLVRELAVGLLLAQGQDLPERDGEGPHVAGHGELTLQAQGGPHVTHQSSHTSCLLWWD